MQSVREAGVGYGMGVAVGDYDNDDNEDLYVTGYGGNHLYHDNGNCNLLTSRIERSGGSSWSTSAAWVDLDDDRLTRLGCSAQRHPDVFGPIGMLVFHNGGNGHFTEGAHKLDLDEPAKRWELRLAATTSTAETIYLWPMTPCRKILRNSTSALILS